MVLEQISSILSEFSTISLPEMDSVSLMDRVDTKYIFHTSQLPAVLEKLKYDFKILVVNNSFDNKYHTTYFDTSDFKLYRLHHAGKLNRYKVRRRTYVNSNDSFLEIKFKNNKGRTTKTRVKSSSQNGADFDNKERDFLQNNFPFNVNELTPKLVIKYSRITLVNILSLERITLDVNLNFNFASSTQHYNNIVIAEVKQNKKATSLFNEIMKENCIKPKSVSKYCLGAISIYLNLIKNNFKTLFLSINKLNNKK